MMNVSTWSIKNPVPSILLFVMLTIVGVMGFRAMKVQQFPDIDLPTIVVTASLPGSAPVPMFYDCTKYLMIRMYVHDVYLFNISVISFYKL